MRTSLRHRLRVRVQDDARQTFWQHHDRDDYECPCCGYEAQGIAREFNVHHIDGDWLNSHLFNLVAICYRCHKRVHRIRNRTAGLDEWKGRANDLGKDDGSLNKPLAPLQNVATDGGERR